MNLFLYIYIKVRFHKTIRLSLCWIVITKSSMNKSSNGLKRWNHHAREGSQHRKSGSTVNNQLILLSARLIPLGEMTGSHWVSFVVILRGREDSDFHLAANKSGLFYLVVSALVSEIMNIKTGARKSPVGDRVLKTWLSGLDHLTTKCTMSLTGSSSYSLLCLSKTHTWGFLRSKPCTFCYIPEQEIIYIFDRRAQTFLLFL